MNEEKDNIFIDVKSANSLRPIEELVEEAYSQSSITLCQYRIGAYMKQWQKAKDGDQVIYAVDDVGLVGGEITYLLKKCFRPRWISDNDNFKSVTHFAHGIDPKKFDNRWIDYMFEQHRNAIEQKRWLFWVLAVFTPTYRLEGNRSILLEKARIMHDAEEELDRQAAKWAMGEYFE